MPAKLRKKAAASDDLDTNGLLSGFQWNTDVIGTEESPLTFSFIEGPLHGKGKGQDFSEWTAEEIAAVIDIFESVEAATDLEFKLKIDDLNLAEDLDGDNNGFIDGTGIEIDTSGDPVDAEIRFIKKELQADTLGSGSYPGNGSNGDVYFDRSTLDGTDTVIVDGVELPGYYYNDQFIFNDGSEAPGSHNNVLLLHEIGHVLGLQHTTEGEFSENFDDTVLNSVMSYEGWEGPEGGQNLPETWTENDWAALQHMYSADQSYPDIL